MSQSSPFFVTWEQIGNFDQDGAAFAALNVNDECNTVPVIPLKNKKGFEFIPDENVFNIDSTFLITQYKFSMNDDGSKIYVVGKPDSVFSPMPDESIYIQNKTFAYQAIYALACAIYELHEKNIAFGHMSYKNFGMNAKGQFSIFGYGFTDNATFETDNENFNQLVCRYFPDMNGKNITPEKIITAEIKLDELGFQQIEPVREEAKSQFKKLHFHFGNIVKVNIKDVYPFLPDHFLNLPKAQVDQMIQNFQVLYGGTPEEAYKAYEETTQKNMRIMQELQSKPSLDPDPNRPFDLFYRKILFNKATFGDKGDYEVVMATDLEGKPIKINLHIRYKKSPPEYTPDNKIFNIDFPTLNNFAGYTRYDNDLVLVSQNDSPMASIISPFESQIRGEPRVTAMFIIGIAAGIQVLHLKGVCADGLNMKKIYIDSQTFKPIIIEYGNPELKNKTMDDDEEDLLAICKDLLPHSFENIKAPVAEKIISGEIKVMDSEDITKYRQELMDQINSIVTLSTINMDNILNQDAKNEKKGEEEDSTLSEDSASNDVSSLTEDSNDTSSSSSVSKENNFNDKIKQKTIENNSKKVSKTKNNDKYKHFLPDLENIPEDLPNQIIFNHYKKIYSETQLEYIFAGDVTQYNAYKNDCFEAQLMVRHYKASGQYFLDPSFASTCEDGMSKIMQGGYTRNNFLHLLRCCGVNNCRSADSIYSLYNLRAGDIPISVAFQLLIDFSPHFVPPQSCIVVTDDELISYAKKGDCGALHRCL